MLALSLAGSAYGAAPVIPVFSGDGSPPKMFVHEGEQRGVLIDILNYADKQMPQYRFELSLYPWARAYMASASGQGACWAFPGHGGATRCLITPSPCFMTR